MKNKTEKLTVSPMVSATIRAFRQVDINSEQVFKIRSVKTGKPVEIKARNLNNRQKDILNKTCDFIMSKLNGTTYEKPVESLMAVTGFLVTGSIHVNGYSVLLDGNPLVMFNSKAIAGQADEFAVTVLHELLHFVTKSGDDKTSDSLEEAEHDLACYALLGISVSTNHWAFKKYPHLLDELLSDSEG